MRTRRLAAVCVAAGAAGLGATYALFVRTTKGQRLDDRLHLDGRGHAAWRLLDAYNSHLLVGEVVVLTVILGSTLLRRQLRRGLLCVAMPVATVLLADLGKRVLPRPALVADWTQTTANTFPSGHVGFAAATVAAVVLAIPRSWRPSVALVGGVAVAAVLVATVQAHWHRASDGVGALFLVLALSGAVVLLSPTTPAAPPVAPSRRREPALV